MSDNGFLQHLLNRNSRKDIVSSHESVIIVCVKSYLIADNLYKRDENVITYNISISISISISITRLSKMLMKSSPWGTPRVTDGRNGI